jgi:hypothetical protein
MRTAAQRIDAYNNRMTSSQIDPTLSAKNTAQKANFAAYASDFVPKITSVHAALAAAGVLPAEYFNYDGFAMEVYHIAQRFTGATAVAACQDLIIKWLLYGCTAPNLKSICMVFSIVVP